MRNLKRYKQNLKVIDNKVYSYDTLVAEIKGDKLHKIYWNVNGMTTSPTTSKHINYVANELNLKLIQFMYGETESIKTRLLRKLRQIPLPKKSV